jgi:hypothetical protein
MLNSKLNLKALRQSRILQVASGGRKSARPSAAWDELALTRRNLFGVAAFAGVGLSPTLNAVKRLLNTGEASFTCETSETRIAFALHGKDRWVIDTRWFTGRPRLLHSRTNGLIRIQLLDAMFPGTRIPADFVCEIRQQALAWQMDLSFTLGGYHSQVPFVPWLTQKEIARADVHLDAEICALGSEGHARLSGYATAEYSPDWTMQLQGGRIITVHGIGRDLESDAVRLVLLEAEAPSLVTNSGKPHTLITIARATRTWSLDPGWTVAGPGHLECPDNVFKTLHLETFEETAGNPACALLAEGTADGPQPAFHLTRTVEKWGGEPLRLPLVGARFVRLFDSTGPGERAFLADYSEGSVAFKLPGCSVHLGHVPGTPPFELFVNGGEPALCCEPAVHRVHLPIAGAIADPFDVPRGTRLNLAMMSNGEHPLPTLTAGPVAEQKTLPGITQVQPLEGKLPGIAAQKALTEAIAQIPSNFRTVLVPAGPLVVPVVRPEDLLVLKFEFRNLQVQVNPGQPPMLVRVPGPTKPMLIVHVPPQNVGEQAFYETADCSGKSVQPKAKSPAEQDRAETIPGEPAKFPIRANLAGWSRLVFRLPDNVPALAYSLVNLRDSGGNDIPGLLDWARLEPVVANAAAPPPDPPLMVIVDPNIKVQPGLSPLQLQQMQQQMRPIPQSVPSQELPSYRWHEVRGSEHPLVRAQVWLASERFVTPPLEWGKPGAKRVQLQLAPQAMKPLTDLGQVLQVAPTPPGRNDLPNITAIEAPFRLFVSPSPMGGWAHSQVPVLRNNRFELWHTRLGVRRQDQRGNWFVDEGDDWYRTLRAIWSPDYDPNKPADWRGYAFNAEKWKHFSAANPTKWNPYRMPLDARDRNELVHLMADSTIAATAWRGRVAKADHFMLSSLGAWIRLRYAADVPIGTPLTVEEWRHRGTMGRDHFVRVVYKGYLFPFGHRASLIKVTERKFELVDNKIVACLRQRMFIIVRNPVKTYPAPNEQSAPSHGRSFPYRKVQFRTLITPNLDDPTTPPSAIPGAPPQEVFWPHVCGKIFSFNLAAEDQAGRVSEFSVPCAFVSSAVASVPNLLNGLMPPAGINPSYLPGPAGRNVTDLTGQKVAYAPMQQGMDTVLETIQLTFGAEIPTDITGLEAGGQPAFYPTVHQGTVRVPAIQDLIGDSTPIAVRYATAYKQVGLTPNGNAGALYLELVNKLGLGFSADKSGGVATPNMDVTALSAIKGPVGGNPAKFASGQFDPKEFFNYSPNQDPQTPQDKANAAKQARLLGGIALADIIQPGAAGEAPHLVSERTGAAATGGGGISERSVDGAITTKLHFETMKLQKDPLNLFNPNTTDPDQSKRSKLTLDAKITIRFTSQGQPAAPECDFSGNVTNFDLNLFKMIIVKFNKMAFKKEHGKNLDVDPDIDDVKFGGPLEFVNKLSDLLGGGSSDKKSAGFLPDPSLVPKVRPAKLRLVADGKKEPACKGGFSIKLIKDFSPKAVKAGFMLCVPDVSVGVLSLTNMRVSAEAELQLLSLVMGLAKELDDLSWDAFKKGFEKAFTVSFAFSLRQDPFHVRVYIFGGGGFFGLKLGTAGLQVLEVSIEFGGMFDLNFGIAKGEAHVFAGIYFKLEKKEIDACVGGKPGKKEVMSILFQGYVRAGGHLNVLGIITVSIELKLSLNYESVGGQSKLWGEASLTIEVEILFFSVSVEVTVRKEFAGSGASGAGGVCALEEGTTRFANSGARAYQTQARRMAQPFPPIEPTPPKIVEMVSKKDWDRYAAAFAAD